MNDTQLADTNAGRAAHAAAAAVAAVRLALEQATDAPDHLVAAGRLRLAYPTATLAELGALANPPISKDTVASRLRRLLRLLAESQEPKEISG